MQRVCAWCRTRLNGEDSGPITHGVCKACMEKLMAEVGTPLRDFLDHLGAPVFLMEEDTHVRSASAAAGAAVGKGLERIVDRLPGEVFECVYASEPGGCGRTVHCTGCTLRRTVLDTFASGRPHTAVPAVLKVGRAGEEKEVAYLISTEKVGGRVLLRIDRRSA